MLCKLHKFCVTLVPPSDSYTDVFLILMSVPSEPPVFRIVSVNCTHTVTSLPPDSIVNVTPLVIVIGPVDICILCSKYCYIAVKRLCISSKQSTTFKVTFVLCCRSYCYHLLVQENIQRYYLFHLKELKKVRVDPSGIV